MSLAPGERQALARIEEALRDSDPALAARIATFTELTRCGRIPRWKWLSPWRLRISRHLPIGIVFAGLGLLILMVALFSHSGGGRGPAQGSCRVAIVQTAGCHSAGRTPAAPGRPGPADSRRAPAG
jgi:hypothetical protein